MQNTTYINAESVGFLNVKEILDTNTSSIDTTSTFSKNSSLPCFVISVTKAPISTTIEDNIVGEITVTVRAIDTTRKKADTASSVAQTLIESNYSNLRDYNMSYITHSSIPLDLERGNQRLFGTEIVYIFGVN